VLAKVQQHVGQRVPDLPRRPQHAQVVAVGEDPAAAPERPVHEPRQADTEGLHAPPQGASVVRLDHEVGVIGLQGVLHNVEIPSPTQR
jgi:hypothetical protein